MYSWYITCMYRIHNVMCSEVYGLVYCEVLFAVTLWIQIIYLFNISSVCSSKQRHAFACYTDVYSAKGMSS